MSRRFSSLNYAPAETRSRLRDWLGRDLPFHHTASAVRRAGAVSLRDEDVLELFLHLDIEFASDEAAARASYASAASGTSGEPDFEALIDEAWLRVIWGRISTPFDIARGGAGNT